MLPVIVIISKEPMIFLLCEQIQICNHQTGTFKPNSAQKNNCPITMKRAMH